MDPAEELHRRAVETGRAHNYAAALELIEEARSLTRDPELLDRLDITGAWGASEIGEHRQAVALCERVLERPGHSALSEGLARSQLALLQMRNGDVAAASGNFAIALKALDGMPEHLAITYLGRGNLRLQIGDAPGAIDDFTTAASQFELSGDLAERDKAVHNLGYAYLIAGDLVAAIRHMDRVRERLSNRSHILRAVAEQDYAEVLLAAGRPAEAIKALESAAAAYGVDRLRRYQAECEFVLSKTTLADEPERARIFARSAAKRFKSHGSDAWFLRAQALATIAEIQSPGRTRVTLKICDDQVARLRDHGYRQDADRLGLHAARLALQRGDPVGASTRAAKIGTRRDAPITTRILNREVRAEIAAASGQPGRARQYARQGLNELHSWQATFGSFDLQSSSVGHGQHLARLGLRAALTDGSPEVVFEWSERARALASRVTSLRPPPDPALAADLTELRVTDPADRAKVRELKERIRSHSWFSATGTVGEPISLKALQARLATDDAALVAHIVLGGTITALAVTATGTAVIPLGDAEPVRALLDRIAADLDFAAQNRTGDIAAAVRGSLRADLATLSDTLVRPLLATIGYRRLVLTPSALFTGTPWTELPGFIGRPLTIPTSASRWFEQSAVPITAPRIAGFVAGPRLQRAEHEVARASEAWPAAQVLTGTDADAARVGWLASRVDLFHVAGHGQHPGDNPLFSAIELADGPWFGHDIDLLPRTPDLVVLSACDLGRATVLHGEESVGMSAAWLHAGARTVVSSPALLADDLACEVFGAWHELVAAGNAPADALAQVVAATDEIVPLLTFGAGW